jgi:hypothetical protein
MAKNNIVFIQFLSENRCSGISNHIPKIIGGEDMKKVVTVIIALTLVLNLAVMASAATKTLDFSSAAQAAHFQAPAGTTGNWQIVDGDFVQTVARSSGEAAIVPDDQLQIVSFKTAKLPKNFTLELEFSFVDANWFGIAFGVPNANETYQSNGGQGYMWLFANGNAMYPRLDFFKCNETQTPTWWSGLNEGLGTEKIKNGKIVDANGINKVKLVKTGTNVKIYVENSAPDMINAKGLTGDPTLEFTEAELDIDGYLQFATGRGRAKIHTMTITADGVNLELPTPTTAPTAATTSNSTSTSPETSDSTGFAIVWLLLAGFVGVSVLRRSNTVRS